MSGDVQPRKRKDKKKKKDEGEFYVSSNEDLNIHVHKEGETGGNVCSKIVFFFLFSALIVLVGLIIKENQGLNEIENIESESRFSQIFEGLIDDKSVDDHDDHSPEVADDHDDDDHDVSEENGSEEDQSQEQDDDELEDAESHSRSEEVEDTEEVPQSEEDVEQVSDEEQNEESDVNEESDEKEDSLEVTEEKTESDETEKVDSKESEEVVPDEILENDVKEEPKVEAEDKTEIPVKGSSGDVKVEEEVTTSKEENKLRENIEAAERQLHENAAFANKLFEALLDQNPFSPRILYGKGKALDTLAEEKQSNQLLLQALSYYMKALNSPSISDQLYVQIATRYIDRARFIGHYKKAITVHWQLIERFPHNVDYFNNLAVTYLTVNMVEDARNILETVLSKWPDDGFALVHYGFILKTKDNNLKDSVDYMTRGLQTKSPGVIDGRFYFHLGDALTRLGRKAEALKLYEEGVQQKVFKSKYQRSLYNVDRLTAKPWWEPDNLPNYKGLFTELQNNWKEIRKEGLSILNRRGFFEDEAENLKDTGTWKQLELFARGQKNSKNCDKTPLTCSIIEKFPDAKSCKRGQTKFSVMHPGTHVWPHCGPTNCRLRVHLGLKVPSNTFIKVADEIRSWKEGDVLIFDDSFEHEVWHNGSGFRLILIVDVWHPDLTTAEKSSLSPI